MSQVTPRTSRGRKSRKAGSTQEAVVLTSSQREPLISGVTDGETFHLIVEPREAMKRRAPHRQETRGLFDEAEAAPLLLAAPVKSRAELNALELPYRFSLGCCSDPKES